jgi:hypothetical protein
LDLQESCSNLKRLEEGEVVLCFLAKEEEEMGGRETCEVLIHLKLLMEIPSTILMYQVSSEILIDFFIPLLFLSKVLMECFLSAFLLFYANFLIMKDTRGISVLSSKLVEFKFYF